MRAGQDSARRQYRPPARPRARAGADAGLRERFPPRAVPDSWEATCQDRDAVMSRLLRAPFTAGFAADSVSVRRLGLGRFLDWLSQFPGDTWQQRVLEGHRSPQPRNQLAAAQPGTVTAWKARLAVKTVPAGGNATVTAARMDTQSCLIAVRAFYLDIAQWALDDPARWGPWAAPCPVRREETGRSKEITRRKSRTDQRTRERLPALPALAAAAARNREAAAGLLAAATAAGPGSLFTSGTVTLRRSVTRTGSRVPKIWMSQNPFGMVLDDEGAAAADLARVGIPSGLKNQAGVFGGEPLAPRFGSRQR